MRLGSVRFPIVFSVEAFMSMSFQISQSATLTDRQPDERRIVDLENNVKSVSLREPFNSGPLLGHETR